MKAFLIVMLGLLLCPTMNGQSMATALLPAVSLGAAARDFDWCSCAHGWLMTCVRDFRKKLESKGYAAGGGGCVLFLQIFYLDHIALPPLSWGHMPRLETLDVATGNDILWLEGTTSNCWK
ncbi:uncharacterized protein LOC110735700 [Chenopodium quinoa]|uniref:uncharacterized protein LOC110735700 n=1 Tax=Chenopodium quinoa TaxID=63459 RepID=UPI000B772038|nr:uncharacterized protein LOC110735700 [Chenopodium quinoa]